MNDAQKISAATPEHIAQTSIRSVVWRYIVRPLLATYVLQLFIVGFWRFVPVSQRDHDGIRYSIHRGFGMWADLIPVLSLMALNGEPVYLVTTDLRTGARDSTGYDLAEDVYTAFPAVWPDKHQ